MATFDGWEEQLFGGYPRLGESCLAHSRTRGSKNGVRRYQTASGEWTPLGLQRRKEREGWGDGRRARREARREQRAAIREAKQRQRSANKEAQSKQRAERKAAIQEERRKNNVKTMTDEELKAKLERARMEAEYREITKSTARRVGERMLTKYFEEKAAKEERAKLKESRDFEMLKMKEQTKQAEIRKAETEARAKADEARAKADEKRADTDRVDIEKGTRLVKLKNERKGLKLQSKRYVSDNTIRGGARRMVNKILSGRGEAIAADYKNSAEYKGILRKGKADANVAVRQAKKLAKYNRKKDPYEPAASIPEGGFMQYHSSSGNDEEKKKKKKQNNSNS